MSDAAPERSGPGSTEFVILIASIMMLVAFAIDSMLPALPAIGRDLGIVTENHRQLVITAFMIGFGVVQVFVGTLSDRFGRRWPVLIALAGYTITSLLAAISGSFELLLLSRVLQGAAAAGGRVVVTSIVRDRFQGREMARIMSLASVVFMAAPILAPAVGALVLEFGPWRWIFGVLAILSATLWLWVALRLPESWPSERRLPVSFAQLRYSFGRVLGDRMSVGYTIALTCFTCMLMGYLVSVQQIFEHVFGRPEFLPWGFAIMAAGMAMASLVNARIVRRYGMRLIGHWGLIWFTCLALVHLLVSLSAYETMWSFIILQTLMVMGFSFAVGNFNAMAMENLGDVAGTAASVQGSFNTIVGALVGAAIGQSFNGSTTPLYIAAVLCGVAGIAAVLVTERGRLFVAHQDTVPQA